MCVDSFTQKYYVLHVELPVYNVVQLILHLHLYGVVTVFALYTWHRRLESRWLIKTEPYPLRFMAELGLSAQFIPYAVGRPQN